jgi:transcriptional regulator with XRE-family HTH domain
MEYRPAFGGPEANVSVGSLLRGWRTARGYSQLELALRSGFSARHLSFIETGRSQPSREALLALAEALDVPLRERNRLLEAGGYARAYRHTPLLAEEMRHVRGLLQFMLDRHEPYGAMVLDRYSNLLMANAAVPRVLGPLVDPSLMSGPVNLLRIVFHPLGVRQAIVNWDEVSHHLLSRARRELSQAPDDDTARELLAEISASHTPVHESPSAALRPGDLLLPVHIRKGDFELRLFSAIMTLGTPQDITLQELRLETFLPADEVSDQRLRALAVN